MTIRHNCHTLISVYTARKAPNLKANTKLRYKITKSINI